MKRYDYFLSSKKENNEIKIFFETIRGKKDIVRILMEACNIILMHNRAHGKDYNMSIVVDKMSRIFIFLDNKYYSVSFTFQLKDSKDNLIISYNDVEINSKIVSLALSALEQLEGKDGIYFIDDLANLDNELCDEDLLMVLRELFKLEDGYLRYDYDPERIEGKRHPLHHIDVMYSNKATFKLGLNSKIDKNDFIDLVDINTDCLFLA